MRAILLIGANFVRSQRLGMAIFTAYMVGIGGLFGWHEPRPDARFFLQWHSFYVVVLAALTALPAIWSERRSKRILAVLSKGIGRWQYLGGILFGCALISAWFCTLLAFITAWLCREGGIAPAGLAVLTLVLFVCSTTAAAAAMFCAVVMHPLPAAFTAAALLFLPLGAEAAGWYPPGELFPVSTVLEVIRAFQFRPPGAGIWAIAASAVLETICFWGAASAIFARSDVTISPE